MFEIGVSPMAGGGSHGSSTQGTVILFRTAPGWLDISAMESSGWKSSYKEDGRTRE